MKIDQMKRALGGWWILLIIPLFLVGCGKDVEFRSTVVVKALTMNQSGDKVPMPDLLVYGYSVDTSRYAPAGYEAALAGILSDRFSDEEITPERSGEFCMVEGHGTAMQMDVSGIRSLYLLVVDRQSRLYGYTQLPMVENLPYLYVSVLFDPYKEQSAYKNGQWWMFNDFYVPKVDCSVKVTEQIIPDANFTMVKSSQLFVYRVDNPNEWYVASFEEAEVGRIRHVESDQPRGFDYSASSANGSEVSLSLEPENYLLLLFNREKRSYGLRALSQADFYDMKNEIPMLPEYPVKPIPPYDPSGGDQYWDDGGSEEWSRRSLALSQSEAIPQDLSLSICFMTWQLLSPYEDGRGWTIYFYPAPVEPEEEPEEL